MYVTSGHDTEVRLTLEATVDLVNALTDGRAGETRALLDRHGFTRAARAPARDVNRVNQRMLGLVDHFVSLPGADPTTTVEWVNDEIEQLSLAPSVVTHDGAPFHIHWTSPTATFDDQVLADILMALVQELCDHGTRRFGRCAAVDCEHLYYDATRNGSRRFCSDSRCASRTHTAHHRARQRSS
jgi:predicted RNA-binding Zn ribbon-like protein